MGERDDATVSKVRARRIAAAASLGLLAWVLPGCAGGNDPAGPEEAAGEAREAFSGRGSFALESVYGDLRCLDVDAAIYPGSMIADNYCGGGDSQGFQALGADLSTVLSTFTFGQALHLQSVTKGFCLEVGQQGYVYRGSCTATDEEVWTPEGDAGSDWVRYRSKSTGLCLGAHYLAYTTNCSANEALFLRPSPRVDSVDTGGSLPARGGSLLTIKGGFLAQTRSVTLGGASCPVVATSDTQVICVAPAGVGAQPLVVHGGMASADRSGTERAASPYTLVYDPPSISSLSASTALANGQPVTLTLGGVNFGPSPVVSVGSVGCSTQSPTDSLITCTTPALAAGQYPVVVTTASGPSNVRTLTLTQPPIVSQLLPSSFDTSGNAALTINGIGFGSPGTVTLGGAVCPVTAWSATAIQCIVPPGEGTVPLVVTTNLGLSSNPAAVIYRPPTITTVMPSTIPHTGGTLTLSGSSFGLSPSVSAGSTACSVTSATQTQIVCTLPATAAGQYPLQITTRSGSSSPWTLTVQ